MTATSIFITGPVIEMEIYRENVFYFLKTYSGLKNLKIVSVTGLFNSSAERFEHALEVENFAREVVATLKPFMDIK